MVTFEQLERAVAAVGDRIAGVTPPGLFRSLGLVLTTACNLNCAYCYQRRGRRRKMPWAVARAALDLFLAPDPPNPSVSFFGGEPLLEFGMIKRIVSHVEATRPASGGVRFRLTTNGVLLGRDAARFLAKHRVATRLSSDGVAAAQRQRGEGTFATLDRLLRDLQRRHPEFLRDDVTVRITLSSDNLPHVADGVRYLLDQGVARISVAPVFTHDPGWRPSMIEALERQFSAIADLCPTGRWPAGIPVTELRGGGARAAGDRERLSMCSIGRNERVVVDVDGETSRCSMLVASFFSAPSGPLSEPLTALRMGDVRDPGWRARLAAFHLGGKAARLFGHKELKYSSYGRCADCIVRDTCRVCPVAIAYQPGICDPDRVPDLSCAFNLVAGAHREKLKRRAPPPRPPSASGSRDVGAGRTT